MSSRVKPNPNRRHPLYCPWCASTSLFPEEDDDFAWSCMECTRVFTVAYIGQNDIDSRPAASASTHEAYERSMAKTKARQATTDNKTGED
ncbi:MAG: hypothetical protein Q3976_01735 [Corynebacterium sp.]|nr:hypothetical protein [Corynebacterium sp.]